MHFDALSLACVTAEIAQVVIDGRVQQVVLVDDNSVGMEIYKDRQRHYLLLSAQPTASHIVITSYKIRRGVDQQTPLLLLLRKYVRGSLVVAVSQPDATERLLRLDFDHPQQGRSSIFAEPMGRSANLILVGPDNRVLEAIRRVHADHGRAVLPNHLYSPPPAQAKCAPVDDGSSDYYAQLAKITEGDDRLWRALVANVRGLSPSMAREVAWRVAGDTNAPAANANLLAIAEALQTLWAPAQTGAWQPGLWREGAEIVGFSAYPAHVKGRFEPTESLSSAVEQFYASRKERVVDAYAALRGTVAGLLRRAAQRLTRQLDGLASDEPEPGEVARLRMEAEWLLAYSTQIEEGQQTLEIDLGEERLTITIQQDRTPVEQAERQFQRARKLERAAKFVPERRAQLTQDLAYLDQLAHDLMRAESQPEIEFVRDELRRMKLLSYHQQIRKRQTPSPTVKPLRYTSESGFEILVGKNARQNEDVTFHIAHGDDLWLHARGVPGAHVIIRRRGAEIDDTTIAAAAQLAAFHSKAQGEKSAEVIVVPRRRVRRISGGRPGQVRIEGEESVTVPAKMPDVVEVVS